MGEIRSMRKGGSGSLGKVKGKKNVSEKVTVWASTSLVSTRMW